MILEMNDIRVLLPQIALQSGVSKFSEIGNRHSSYSNEFTLPVHNEVVQALNFSFSLGHNHSEINTKQDAVLYSIAGKFVSSGFVQIVSADHIQGTVTLRYYSGNIEWFSKLENKLIGDLDLREYNHTWSESEIVAGLDNTHEDGYIYHPIDYGEKTFRADLVDEVTEWFPSVYQAMLIRKIFQGIDYTIEGSFLEDPIYLRTVLPFTNRIPVRSANQAPTLVSGFMQSNTFVQAAASGSLPIGVDSTGFDPDFTETNDPVQFNISTDQWENTNPGGSFYSFRLITTGQASYVYGGGFNQPGNNSIALKAVVYNATTLSPLQSKNLHAVQSFDGNTNRTVTVNFNDVFGFTALPGTKFLIKIVLEVTTVDIGPSIQYNITMPLIRIEANNTESPDLLENDTWSIAANLPRITQRDLVKDMIIRHGLMVQKTQAANKVKIDPYRTVFRNMTNAEDWSAKVAEGEVKEISYIEPLQAYGKLNNFRYREEGDRDYWVNEYNGNQKDNFGDGNITLPNQFLQPEKDIYTSIFAPTRVITSYNGQVKIPYIPRFDYTGELGETTPRILIVSDNMLASHYGFGDPFTAWLIGGAGGTSTFYAPFSWFYKRKTDLEVGAPFYNSRLNLAWNRPQIPGNEDWGLLNEWYEEIERTLKKPALVEVSVRLREFEFSGLDFTIPIRIHSKGINGMFALDSIEEYRGFEKPCIARLIQIN